MLAKANDVFRNKGQASISVADLEITFRDVPDHAKEQVYAEVLGLIPQMPTIGIKPTAAAPQAETWIVRIPNDVLSNRFYAGGAPPKQDIIFFDFYNTAQRTPQNKPADYRLKIQSPPEIAGKLDSMEVAWGEVPKPGMESFTVPTKAVCVLRRQGHPPFTFEVPSKAGVQGVAQAVPFV